MIPANRDNVIKACKGDKNAFSELIQERKNDIYRIAYTYVKNEEEALEILHDTVYKALISVKKLKNVECFNAWLSRIIVTCSMDFLKKKKKANWSELHINGQEEAEKI
ncbi:MAG TPA: sigma-70 family RNA polymerase sigma factor, partial [Clostridia bacterium]|nr:sigma-70 family RNA polymerase sigma factor [Clostridia bacterium]